MATYITLLNFTDQGIRSIRDTVKRAQAFKELAAKNGVTVREIFWTQGQYDLVTVFDASDDETATALLYAVGALGNVRTQTLRGFSIDEVARIIDRMPKM
jgi:uncharacterized protein with GYD domain